MTYSDEEIDRGAEALREHEQGGKRLREWKFLPNGVKEKWRRKAQVVLEAAWLGALIRIEPPADLS